jgi:hypothetical protein
MMKLNREQIIKALECCTRAGCSMATNADCPLINDEGCASTLPHYALSLIKELTEENESLEAEKEHLEKVVEGKLKRTSALEKSVLVLTEDNHILATELKRVQEENERARAECENQSTLWKKHFESIYETAKETLKADTVRRMQSEIKTRCIEGGIYPAFVARTIDRIANEMLEEEK